MAASDPFNETIGASEKPSATESWPHKTKEQEWVQVTKKKLEQQLKAQIESKDLEVEQLGSQLVIRIGEKALFPRLRFPAAPVHPAGQQDLRHSG